MHSAPSNRPILPLLRRTFPSRRTCQAMIGDVLNHGKFFHIATLNPAIALESRKNPALHRAIKAADCVTADGIGVALAARCLGYTAARVTGNDLIHDLLAVANENNVAVTVLLPSKGKSTVAHTRALFARTYPHMQVTVYEHDDPTTPFRHADDARIVLCAFGSPQQEIFLSTLRKNAKHGMIALGVGGGIDFLTGAVRRAPRFLQKCGCEWLWRTAVQPRRFGKMCRSLIVFPLVVAAEFLREHFYGQY